MKKFAFLLFICSFPGISVLSGQSALDEYVRTALDRNIALQRQELSYARSLEALQEAKALFWPKLSLQARYSVARGGRAILIPVGDLMHPVYENLNVINQLGQAATPDYPVIPEYPRIENVSENFLRETEQETFLRVAMPLFNQMILTNHKIRQNLAEAERLSADQYRRQLIHEVKAAFYQYHQAREALDLYRNTLDLVRENLRTTESLQRNHQVTADAVYLAEAQVMQVEQELAAAEQAEKTARAYFNFLLNRDYAEAIAIVPPQTPALAAVGVDEARSAAWQKREELKQFQFFLSAADDKVKLEQGALLPNVNLVADYGIQGTRYALGRDDDYFMGSVVMSWTLFDRSNKHRVEQARIERESSLRQQEEVRQQIGLEVVNAHYALEAARKQVAQAEAARKATESAFRLVRKQYSQGQVNLVTFTDARTQMTNAAGTLIIARYDLLVKVSDLERVTGAYPLD